MEILSIFQFIYERNELVIAVLVILILLTGMVFLFRTANDRQEGTESTSISGMDLQSLEGTLKRVLSQGQIVSAGVGSGVTDGTTTEAGAGTGVAPGGSAEDASKMTEMISERDQRINELQQALAAAHTEVETQAQALQKANSGQKADEQETTQMRSQIEELEARLSEYSIIEDDIADLSLFKEENTRLKDEVENLKQELDAARAAAKGAPVDAVGAKPAAVAAEPATAESPASVDHVAATDAPATSDAGEQETGVRFEKAEKFGIDVDDDIMKEFAAAVSGQAPAKMDAATSIPIVTETAPAASVEADTVVDPQAAIDAMLNGFAAEAPASEPAAAADPQAAIDALLNAEPDSSSPSAENDEAKLESALAAMISEPPPEPVKQTDIDAMFNAAVAAEAGAESGAESGSDVLDGAPDTDKMLEEVAQLQESDEAGDALAEALDTDKLLLEVDALRADGQASAEPVAGEDLFGEFADEGKDHG